MAQRSIEDIEFHRVRNIVIEMISVIVGAEDKDLNEDACRLVRDRMKNFNEIVNRAPNKQLKSIIACMIRLEPEEIEDRIVENTEIEEMDEEMDSV